MHPDLLDLLLPSSVVVLVTAIESILACGAYFFVARAQGLSFKQTARGAALWGVVSVALLTYTWRGWPPPARLQIFTYWVLDISAFGLLILLCMRTASRRGLEPQRIVAAAPVFILTSLFLSRLLFLLRDRFYGQPSPLDSMPFFTGFVLTNQGANTFMVVLGSSLGLLLYLAVKRLPLLPYLDVLFTNAPLGLGLAKVGCFSAGCCWGLQSASSPFGVRFPPGSPVFADQSFTGIIGADAAHSLPVLPVQLYEVGCLVLLFLVLAFLARQVPRPGQISCAFLFGYALIEGLMETMRGDRIRGGPVLGASSAFYNLTLQHLLAFGFLIAAVSLTLALWRSWQKPEVLA